MARHEVAACLPAWPSMVPAVCADGRDPHAAAHASSANAFGGRCEACWHGTIQTLDREFRLVLTMREPPVENALPAHSPLAVPASLLADELPPPPPATPMWILQIDADPDLAQLMEGHEQTLKQYWQQSRGDVDRFLLDFNDLATRILRARPAATSATSPVVLPPAFFAALASELTQLPGGWRSLAWMNEADARELRLQCTDAAGRTHLLDLRLPESYPLSLSGLRVTAAGLPVPFDAALPASLAFPASPSALGVLYARFCAAVEASQRCWDLLDGLDREVWVLEPEAPRPREGTTRKIAVDRSCTLELTVDPLQPLALPQLRLHGDAAITAPLTATIQRQVQAGAWHVPPAGSPVPADFLLRGLLRLLERSELPRSTALNKSDYGLECDICSAYRLEGVEDAPSIVCAQCRHSFHRCCLAEWLASDASTTEVFDSLRGNCPQCRETIVVAKA